jgi:DNA-binding MarR family transcriptional regulator
MTGDATSEVLASRLGYLLKHASLRLTEAYVQALAPFGLDGRELAVLAVLAAHDPLSQLEAAGRLGVDRTTMVALVDTLESKDLVVRRRSPHDRRKNVVELTPTGRERLPAAERARQEAESRLLAPLSPADSAALFRALQALALEPQRADQPPG